MIKYLQVLGVFVIILIVIGITMYLLNLILSTTLGLILGVIVILGMLFWGAKNIVDGWNDDEM